MMKIPIYILAAALTISSCSQNDDQQSAPSLKKTTLSVRANQTDDQKQNTGSTRAMLDNSVSKWETGDQIALYASSYTSNPSAESAKLTATSLSDNGKSAEFSGMGSQTADIDNYFATYPANAKLNATSATFVIESIQAPTSTPKLMMAAQSLEQPRGSIPLEFQPLNAFLSIKLAEGLDLSAIIFESCDNQSVAGDFTYTFADKSIELTGTSKSITIQNPTGEVFITLPAITLAKGYKLTLLKGDEKMIKSYGYGTPMTFQAGAIYKINTISEFIPTTLAIGEAQSSFTTPNDPLILDGKIYTKGNNFQGIPISLIKELGIEYNVKGSTIKTRVSYDKTLLDKNAIQKSFDLTLDLPSEQYEICLYITDVLDQTLTSPTTTIGVLNTDSAISVSATSSYDSNGVVAKNNDFTLGGNGLLMSVDLINIAPNLVASSSFTYSGGSTGTIAGTIANPSVGILTNLSPDQWSDYTVDATITLHNGQILTGQGTATVTGLPYSVTFYGTGNAQNWTTSNCGWRANYLDMLPTANSNGYIVSPAFNVQPDMTTLSYYIVAKYYISTGIGYVDATMYIGSVADTNSTNKNDNSKTITKKIDSIELNGQTAVSGAIESSPTLKYVAISHNNPKRYNIAPTGYLGVASVNINY